MSRKTYELVVKTRTYRTNDGQEKAVWQNIGAMMEDDQGRPFLMIERWFNPAGVQAREGASAILVSCFEPREGEQSSGPVPTPRPGQPQARAQPGARPSGGPTKLADDLDDEIPF